MLIIIDVQPVNVTYPKNFKIRAMVAPIMQPHITKREKKIIKYIGTIEKEIIFSRAKIVSLL